MAEESDSDGGGGGLGGAFPLVFFGSIVIFWFISGAGNGPGLFGGLASSTADRASSTPTYLEVPRDNYSERAIDLDYASREVRALREEVEDAKLWGTHSPYEGTITLESGNTSSSDEDEEYLRLYNGGREAVTITGWKLASHVTGERGTIPEGAHPPRSGRLNDTEPIVLLPGDFAIVVSGTSPNGVSFKENMCTGYFEQYQDFYPPLTSACPYPNAELRASSRVALDDDRCYDFVATLRTCEVARAEARSAHISASCEAFVTEELTYTGCVENHAGDSEFEERTWRIFLEENDDLWREEREIIKLQDSTGRTVDLIEY